jgi:hypothetical protein
MSFLKRLFGGGEKPGSADNFAKNAEKLVDYKGYSIIARPMAENGQFRVAGTISKTISGEIKAHHFIRADVFADHEAAMEATLRKGQLIVDQSGDDIF